MITAHYAYATPLSQDEVALCGAKWLGLGDSEEYPDDAHYFYTPGADLSRAPITDDGLGEDEFESCSQCYNLWKILRKKTPYKTRKVSINV